MKSTAAPLRQRLPLRAVGAAALALSLALGLIVTANASSHREAPLISEDPVADNTDVYAFVSPDKPDTVTIVSNFIPFEEPAGGPNFHNFGEDVGYKINIDNDGDARDDMAYEFRFRTTVQNPGTFLYNTGPITSLTDPDFNIRQTYSVTRVSNGHRKVVARGLRTPPANIGPRSTPNYERLARMAVHSLPGGGKVFAGPRDDPFYADLGSIFDLGGLRPLNQAHLLPLPAANGKDGVSGYNTHTIALQLPRRMLVDSDPVIGVYSTSYRREVRVLTNNTRRQGQTIRNRGRWIQVSRLGMPLVNEVVIPLKDKDRWNNSRPVGDAQFLEYVADPELARLIPVLYPGVKVPKAPRTKDIVPIFLTGIPGLNQPEDVRPSEMIRLNTDIAPTPMAKQNRLGLLAGQNDGFPNGRRLVDDVVDIELRALAGGTPFTPAFNKSPNNILGDGVNRNDRPFLSRFPYVATPQQGYDHNHNHG